MMQREPEPSRPSNLWDTLVRVALIGSSVILFGALGGMATGGILGMFVGATAPALG
jgi:hypothetical protein